MIKTYKQYLKIYVKVNGRDKKLNFISVDDRLYYVYRVTHIEENISYYGSRICKSKVSPMFDLYKYCTSSERKKHILANKEQYKFKVIKVFNNYADMICYESFLHQYFDVKTNNSFFNKANQLPHSFSTAGIKKTDAQKQHLRNINTGKIPSKESIEKCRQSRLGVPLAEDRRNKIRIANTGKKATEESKLKMSISAKKRKPNFKGMKHSEKSLAKMRESHKNIVVSPETKEKLRMAKLGKLQPLSTCPHCGKVGGASNMKRWHFENCKNKGEVLND